MNQKMMPERTKLYWHLWIQYLSSEGLLNAFLDALLHKADQYSRYLISQQRRQIRMGHLREDQALTEDELVDNQMVTLVVQMARRSSVHNRLTDGMYSRPQVFDEEGEYTHVLHWSNIAEKFYNENIKGRRPQKINLRMIKQAEEASCSD